jgi:hypothetical protein
MSEGALLDLVTRGKKDAYFIQGARRTWFGSHYEKRSPSTREVIVQNTTAPARFNHWVDIDLPRTGDVLMSVDIRIQLPTWLPSNIVAMNKSRGVAIETPGYGSVIYGWTNGIANFLIERWALFMDNIMLQQGYGTYNDWHPVSDNAQMHAPVINLSTGTNDYQIKYVQQNAVPGELNFRVPLIGCQQYRDSGFPLSAIKAQRLYLRIWLNDKADLVQGATTPLLLGGGTIGLNGPPNFITCPAPWGGKKILVSDSLADINFTDSGEVTLQEYEMGQPNLYGNFTVLHFDPQMSHSIRNSSHSVTYTQQIRHDFTIEDSDWLGTNPIIKKQLEINGLVQRLMIGFISLEAQKQNEYRNLAPPLGASIADRIFQQEWLESVTLVVNGQERILPWDPRKFQNLANNTQLRRDVERDLYFLVFGVSPDLQPAGAFNMDRTQKVTLILNLTPNLLYSTNLPIPTRQTFAWVKGEAWNVLDIVNGVASVRFNDLT